MGVVTSQYSCYMPATPTAEVPHPFHVRILCQLPLTTVAWGTV